MDELSWERGELLRADEHIIEGETRTLRQRKLIERMPGRGDDIAKAKRLLATFEQTLTEWKKHRTAICRRIAGLGERQRPLVRFAKLRSCGDRPLVDCRLPTDRN